jgi:hypothetical protein
MKHLFEILSILVKYQDENLDYDVYPEEGRLFIEGPNPNQLSKEDAEILAGLPCAFDEEDEIWEISF